MRKGMGWVHVICGPMCSGKTEALLRLVRRFDIMGRSLMVFRPDIDTRHHFVASRSGVVYPGATFSTTTHVLEVAETAGLEVVALDEAQFFDGNLPYIVEHLARKGVHVLVSGLDRDFAGRPFGPMGELLVMADEVSKLTAICVKCKGEASLTQRLVDGRPASKNDPLVVIGGFDDELYEPRCRACHEVAP